jgi:hypothetical protein
MDELVYQCCVCGKGITKDDPQTHAFDPCAVVLIGNWSQAAEEQREQQFFCHFQCFRRVAEQNNPGILDYMVDEGKPE